MNLAILFDSCEEQMVMNPYLILDKSLYSYSLEAFYKCSNVDEIIILFKYPESGKQTRDCIVNLSNDSGIDKRIHTYYGIRTMEQVWVYILQDLGVCPKTIFFHDFRVPIVKDSNINALIEKLSDNETAITCYTEDDENLYSIDSDGNLEVIKNTYIGCYPAAARGKASILKRLDAYENIPEEFGYSYPTICRTASRNIFVYTEEDCHKVESYIKTSGY